MSNAGASTPAKPKAPTQTTLKGKMEIKREGTAPNRPSTPSAQTKQPAQPATPKVALGNEQSPIVLGSSP